MANRVLIYCPHCGCKVYRDAANGHPHHAANADHTATKNADVEESSPEDVLEESENSENRTAEMTS